MLKIFVLKRRSLYIGLAILAILIIGILVLIFSGSDETFSETMKYAYKEISPEQAKVLIEKNPDVTVFDLRDEEEYLQGHLPSATQLSYKELKKKLSYYNREGIYIIYGSSDKKSAKAADLMANKGFPKIFILHGGFDNWPYEVE
ncbi:rhodanese-like domain-containing protein [Crassaminicella thermophila]|uniref:Rhodanese-like domain-containing protein n=1 Tax=Crassaminicella thermophila TaxID=2599308 RepID=A0A5C0SIU8_CRATE|nr:rhodanese-like domain-containing protein [Crassaminicella thermophila]QEK13364.1 rhodanese-like domain-containing protein [Crassaminicella thermophila]